MGYEFTVHGSQLTAQSSKPKATSTADKEASRVRCRRDRPERRSRAAGSPTDSHGESAPSGSEPALPPCGQGARAASRPLKAAVQRNLPREMREVSS